MLEAALATAGVPPEACVIIGNSEARDIVPARELGMRAIRVAIEEPCPETTCADALACSLAEAASLLLRLSGRS
jgi:FMN phosphatase YigB (HAD superfamily)